MSNVSFIIHLCSSDYSYRIEATDNNVIIVTGFQGTGIFGAREPKHIGYTHQMYEYNRYCTFKFYYNVRLMHLITSCSHIKPTTVSYTKF
jgi:hypothetical protein